MAQVGQLCHDRRTLFVNVVGQRLEIRHRFVTEQFKVAESRGGIRADKGTSADHRQRDAAASLLPVISPVPLFR
jgi:hypothetical protein